MVKISNERVLSAEDHLDECTWELNSIIKARDALAEARKNFDCRCSAFILQYEGSCRCEAGRAVGEAEGEFWEVIRSL